MKFFDLKTGIFCGNSASYPRKDLKHEQRKICVCPIDGISSGIRVSEVRREIQRRIQSQEFLVHGSVSDNGVCTTHLQRKSSGYCNMSGCRGGKTLSHGEYAESSFRSRFYDHRHMSFSLPVGKIPKTQRGCETAYSSGREKCHASSHIYFRKSN